MLLVKSDLSFITRHGMSSLINTWSTKSTLNLQQICLFFLSYITLVRKINNLINSPQLLRIGFLSPSWTPIVVCQFTKGTKLEYKWRLYLVLLIKHNELLGGAWQIYYVGPNNKTITWKYSSNGKKDIFLPFWKKKSKLRVNNKMV